MAVARVALALISMIIGLILVIPVVLLALPFLVVARLSQAAAQRLEPKYVPWDQVLEYQPLIGWKPKPGLNAHYLDAAGDLCHVVTDADGWLGKRKVSESQIVVFGDSFAFGYGVDTKVSYAELVSGAWVKGIGAPGYSMVQGLLLMRQMSDQLRNKLVVWMICLDNDLYDNLNPETPKLYKSPFVRFVNGRGQWEVVTHHVRISRAYQPAGPSPYYPFLAHLCTPGPISQRAYSASDYLIREAKAICHKAGATLVILTVPNKHQLTSSGVSFLASHLENASELDPGYPDLRISETCQRLCVRFVALRSHLTLDHYKMADVHWNEAGHRKVAELLDEVYEEYVSEEAKAAKPVAGSGHSPSQPIRSEGAVRTRRAMQ